MLKTTLNELKAHSPCVDGWEKLLKSLGKTEADDEPLGLDYILESNGVSECVWALRTQPNGKLIALKFAIFCAQRVLPIYEESHPNDKRPRNAIEAARQYLIAPSEDNAADAARGAAEAGVAADRAAAWSTAVGAADAAWASAAAARAADAADAAYAAADAAYAAAWATDAAARAAWASAAAAGNAAWADEEHVQKQELLRLLKETVDNA